MAKKEADTFKIIHEMADGTILDSIEGIVIPLTPETYMAYKTIADVEKRKRLQVQRKEETA